MLQEILGHASIITALDLVTPPTGLSCTWDEELTESVILC
jgi:hypothetical protein